MLIAKIKKDRFWILYYINFNISVKQTKSSATPNEKGRVEEKGTGVEQCRLVFVTFLALIYLLVEILSMKYDTIYTI